MATTHTQTDKTYTTTHIHAIHTDTHTHTQNSKLANTSGWSNKIPIPFTTSVIVTFKGEREQMGWLFVRGVENVPVVIGGLTLPPSARLEVQHVHRVFQPLEFVELVSVPAGKSGVILVTMINLASGSLSVLEGCVYLFPSAKVHDIPSVTLPSPNQSHILAFSKGHLGAR